MRKSLAFISGALLIGAASCSQEEVVSPVAGGGNVNFQVSLPAGGYGTRAFSDGYTATDLTVAVYDASNDAFVTSKKESFPTDDLKTTVSLNLANGKAYKIVFFASKESQNVYTFNTETATLSVNYSQMTDYNSEDYDCFYVMEETGVVKKAINKDVTLTRPLAQVNWGTADLKEPTVTDNGAYGKDAANLVSSVEFKGESVFTTLNMLDGTVSGNVDGNTLTFPALARPDASKEDFPVTGYEYLSMTYLLVDKENAVVDAILTISNGSGLSSEVSVPSMPIQRNYRTNVYGNLITSPAKYTVEKDKEYIKPDHMVAATPEAFQEALQKGATEITLQNDMELSFFSTANTSLKTLNLDGHTVKVSGFHRDGTRFPAIENWQKELTIDGGDGEPAKIVSDFGAPIVKNYLGTLTINNVEIELTSDERNWDMPLVNYNGDVKLTNVTLKSSKAVILNQDEHDPSWNVEYAPCNFTAENCTFIQNCTSADDINDPVHAVIDCRTYGTPSYRGDITLKNCTISCYGRGFIYNCDSNEILQGKIVIEGCTLASFKRDDIPTSAILSYLPLNMIDFSSATLKDNIFYSEGSHSFQLSTPNKTDYAEKLTLTNCLMNKEGYMGSNQGTLTPEYGEVEQTVEILNPEGKMVTVTLTKSLTLE